MVDVVMLGVDVDNNKTGNYLLLDENVAVDNVTKYHIQNVTSSKNVADAEWNEQARIVALWVQIVIGTIGGLCACAWLWRIRRRRKSRVNVIFLHVTIADLLVMVATLAQVVWEMAGRWWLIGDATCRIVKFFQSFSMMASSNMLVLLSIDRHQAIRSPLRNPMQVWKLSLPFWLAAALLSIPMLFMFHVVDVDDPDSQFYNMTVCESVFRLMPLHHRQAFLTSMSIIHVFAPCVIICTCYVRIFIKVAQKASEARSGQSNAKPGKVLLQSTKSTALPRAKVKSLKMTVVIVTVFIICGVPYHILEMLFNFWSHLHVPPIVSAILGALPVANSVVNPYIFLAFSADRRILGHFCRKGPHMRDYPDCKSTNSNLYTTRTTVLRRYSDYNTIEMTQKDVGPVHGL